MKNLSFEKKLVGSFLIVSAAFAVMLYAFHLNTQTIKLTTEKINQSQEALRNGDINNTTEWQRLEMLEAENEASMNSFEKVLITLVVFIDAILILVGAMIFQNQRVRKKYEEQLRQSNDELESFSYMVSHDLRSPVRAVLGLTERINKKYEPDFDAELKEMFELIESKSQRMNVIIEDLLALAQNGKKKLEPSTADMTELFTKVWSNIRLSMPNKAILEMPLLPYVTADASMIEQVIENLCSNAVKYSSQKELPIVKVGYRQEKNTTTFFVKDNGAGFDMKNYGRLFKPFQRLHHAAEFEGTGVGLLLVKRIIELHRGKIWAESKPNEGATFYFTLPSNS